MKHLIDQLPHPDMYIRPILITMIYSRTAIGITATLVNAAILVFIMRGVASRLALIVWFIAITVVSVIRLIFIKKFQRSPDKMKDIQRSEQRLIFGVGALGVLWGSTAIFFYPNGSVMHQVFIAFILAGMVAGAVGVYSPIMPAYLSFCIPALTPISIRFVSIGDEIHIAMGVMISLFGILMYIAAKYMGESFKELVLLKESFSDRLQERTKELIATNTLLKQEIEKRRNVEKSLIIEKNKLQETLSEIKILKGFIPICASCHKIRDDEGFWQSVERYIQDRSDAKFSHSICPECAKKLYPDFEQGS